MAVVSLAERVRRMPCVYAAHGTVGGNDPDAWVAERVAVVTAVRGLEEAAWAYVLSEDAEDSPRYRALVKALEGARG